MGADGHLRGQRPARAVPWAGWRRRGAPVRVPQRTAEAPGRGPRPRRVQRPPGAQRSRDGPLDSGELPLRTGPQEPGRQRRARQRLAQRAGGEGRPMGTFDAGLLGAGGGQPAHEVVFRTTVHGPVVGYATTHGRRVAISSQRSSRGRETLFQLAFQDLSLGRVHDPKSFFHAFAQSPLTFNAFYADSKHIAEYTAGRLPLRAPGVDPGLPTEGTGKHEWRGFLSANAHPHAADPKSGVILNWNNRSARDFQAADSEWGYSSVMRDELLVHGLRRHRIYNLATLTGVMNRAATQDVREAELLPTLARLLETGPAPNARDA